MPEDQVTKDMRALTEIERRKKYLSEVRMIKPLMMLVTACLKNSPDQRPVIGEVVKKLQSIVTEESLLVYDNVIELDKQLSDQKIFEKVVSDHIIYFLAGVNFVNVISKYAYVHDRCY